MQSFLKIVLCCPDICQPSQFLGELHDVGMADSGLCW